MRDAIAHRLDLVHLVRRKDRRPAALPPFLQQLLDEPDVDRIEARCRLVEHAQLWIAQEHRGNLDLLRHPFAQPLDLPARDLRQLHPLEPLSDRRRASWRSSPFNAPK